MPIVIWAGQGRDSPLVYFQQKQNIKRRSGSVYSRVTKSRHTEQKEGQAVQAAYNVHFSKVPPYTLQLCASRESGDLNNFLSCKRREATYAQAAKAAT